MLVSQVYGVLCLASRMFLEELGSEEFGKNEPGVQDMLV